MSKEFEKIMFVIMNPVKGTTIQQTKKTLNKYFKLTIITFIDHLTMPFQYILCLWFET